MMKKNKLYVSFIPFLCLILIISVGSIKPVRQAASNAFWNWVAEELEKEEQERIEKAARGEVVRGKDTALIWCKHYDILHQSGDYHLNIFTRGLTETILEKIQKYKVIKKKLYVLSEEGYAVIDRYEICRVFITVPESEFVSGFYTDKEGNKTYISRRIEDEHIIYLSSYDDFTAEEKKAFEKLVSSK